MTDGIYEADVYNYRLLLSKQGGTATNSHNDWFYWWLNDNGIDYMKVDYVCYNELQGIIYVQELDFEHALFDEMAPKLKLRKRGPLFVMKDYPVVADPPAILLDRWDWLMEVFYGGKRSLCPAA